MKKTKLIFGFLFLIGVVVLTSCGGSSEKEASAIKTIALKPSKLAFDGEMSEYLEVVDGQYSVIVPASSDYSEIKIKVKALKVWDNIDKKTADDITSYRAVLELNIVDDSGIPVSMFQTYEGWLLDDAILPILQAGKGEAILTFKYSMYDTDIETINSADLSVAKKFIVSGKMEQYKSKPSESSSANATSSSSSVDCDKFIKDYESFVNNYITILKKYKKNPSDASILSEYTEMMQKAVEMQSNASNCSDAKYATKLMELANKMATVAL